MKRPAVPVMFAALWLVNRRLWLVARIEAHVARKTRAYNESHRRGAVTTRAVPYRQQDIDE